MMKTIRMKIKNWKVLAVALTLPLFFFAVACQDQIEEIQEVGKNTSMALEIPKEVQDELNRMKIEAPDSEFIVVELNENGKQSLEKLKESNNTINDISKISVIRPTDDEISFAIIVKGRNTDRLSEITKSTDQVFTIVDEPASPTTSMTEFYGEIAKNLNYPDQARKLGVEGRVFIEFIVNEDGTLSGFKSLKGIGAGCDNEAIRVLKMSKPWNPGKQKGHVVKQRLVLPITFSLG